MQVVSAGSLVGCKVTGLAVADTAGSFAVGGRGIEGAVGNQDCIGDAQAAGLSGLAQELTSLALEGSCMGAAAENMAVEAGRNRTEVLVVGEDHILGLVRGQLWVRRMAVVVVVVVAMSGHGDHSLGVAVATAAGEVAGGVGRDLSVGREAAAAGKGRWSSSGEAQNA